MVELQSRFREYRRPDKVTSSSTLSASSCSTSHEDSAKSIRKHPGITKDIPVPKQVDGEDNFSFAQHNKLLKTEFGKSKPNNSIISEIMDLSFPMRRHDIISNCYLGVKSLFGQYPFLQTFEQVSI